MQFSEKLLDMPVSELSVRELLSLISHNTAIKDTEVENKEKLFNEEEWIRGWRNLSNFCDLSVPTLRSWYKHGTRKVGAFFYFNKAWLRQHLL